MRNQMKQSCDEGMRDPTELKTVQVQLEDFVSDGALLDSISLLRAEERLADRPAATSTYDGGISSKGPPSRC